MKNLKKLFAFALAAALVVTAAGCGAADTASKGSDSKILTLATSADFPPYEFVADDGSYTGIDVDIATAIAKKLGMTLKVENMDFNSIVTSVSTGKYDMGMAGLTVTDERKESVAFSDSYATGVQSVIVKEGSAIKTVDDLYAEGVTYKVGAQLSTTGDIYFSQDISDKKTTCSIEEFKTGADAVQALVNGQIDCIIIDNQPAKSFVAANKGLQILDTEYANEDYAICFSKSNSALREKVNAALEELISDGTVKTIVDKYITSK